MKIYTKTGDQGTTSLIGGKRVPKHHTRIEAYGTVDELISYIGLIRDLCPEQKELLLNVQDMLMRAASALAYDYETPLKKNLPEISEQEIVILEREMDRMEDQLPALQSFILPGGHFISSHCHIARSVCRRVERLIVKLAEHEQVPQNVLKYLNRLADFLFVFARKKLYEQHLVDNLWKPLA